MSSKSNSNIKKRNLKSNSVGQKESKTQTSLQKHLDSPASIMSVARTLIETQTK